VSIANGTAGRSKAAIDFGEGRPQALPVDPLGIAEALKARPQWVGWKYVRREAKDGRWKWTKVPIDVKTGRTAKSTDPSTWTDFPTAWRYFCDHNDLDGIGYVFSPDDPFTGIDLDDCVDTESGLPLPWAKSIVDELRTYTEVSPSGTGLMSVDVQDR
jgi:primase-polymerase (primpol)-like protein